MARLHDVKWLKRLFYHGIVIGSIGLLVLIAVALAAPAQAAAPTPEVFLEDSTIVGAGGTLTINQLQFTDSAGNVHCKDVTIPFSVGSPGGLVIGTPDVTKCVALQINQFVAGTYAYLTSPKDNTVQVSGPSVGVGGSTGWSLSLTTTADGGTFVIDAEWIVGPLSDNPEAEARLKACSITPDPNASYGFGKDVEGNNSFFALKQVNNTLTLQGYGGSCGVVYTIVYNLSPPG